MKLDGLRVLDLSMFLPGPHLTLMLADHGAEVIRIEAPGGEPSRAYGPFESGPGGAPQSIWFRNLHRGKKSLCLNLKHDAGREILLRLVDTADVLVEGFRPGAMEKLGLGPPTLRARNRRLVYCSLSAFGHTGPLRAKATHDMGAQALSGFLAINDGGDGRPVVPGFPSADAAAAMMGLAGVLMALYARDRTGEGDFVDIAMADALLSFSAHLSPSVIADGRAPTTRTGRSIGGAAFYSVYETEDGRYLALTGREEKFVDNLLRALGRPDLAPLCKTDDCAAQGPVRDFLAATFKTRDLNAWTAFLTPLDVGWAPVLDMAEAFDQPQARQREMVVRDPQGRVHVGNPLKFAADPARLSFDSPTLGQHAEAILADLGYDDATIDALRRAGTLGPVT